MTFFEDNLAALGRAIDRSLGWLTGSRSSSGPTLGERLAARRRAAAEYIEKARFHWKVAPDAERRRTLTIAGVSFGTVLALLIGLIVWNVSGRTAVEQRAITDANALQQKILEGQNAKGTSASLFPGAH